METGFLFKISCNSSENQSRSCVCITWYDWST